MDNLRLDYLAARLSSASYPGEQWRVHNMLDDFVHIKGKQHDGDVFIGEGYEYNWCVFRGTEVADGVNWKDVWTDLRFIMRRDPENTYRISDGFLDAWVELSPRVFETTGTIQHIQTYEHGRPKPWVFTGHSLGAALATVAAAAFKPAHCITFGGPRVGNKAFADIATDACEFHRWVNKGDWCPRLPPPWLGHRHSGDLYFIDRKGELRINPSKGYLVSEVLADAVRRWKRHGVENYVDNIEALINRE